MGFPGGSAGKEPAMQETQAPSLGWEDPLEEEGNPLQYSCLENPHGKRSLAGYSSLGHTESDTTEWLTLHLYSNIKLSLKKKKKNRVGPGEATNSTLKGCKN